VVECESPVKGARGDSSSRFEFARPLWPGGPAPSRPVLRRADARVVREWRACRALPASDLRRIPRRAAETTDGHVWRRESAASDSGALGYRPQKQRSAAGRRAGRLAARHVASDARPSNAIRRAPVPPRPHSSCLPYLKVHQTRLIVSTASTQIYKIANSRIH